MSELHDLSPVPGSRKNRKRVGRGPGSGTGKTSGRGQKGQKARSGGNIPPGFEGGQMPLHRRIPKRGFTNIFRTEYQVVNVRDLNGLEGDVDPRVLKERGLVGSTRRPVKILGEGELEVALQISAHAFSKSAREKIEGAGGTVTELDLRDTGSAAATRGTGTGGTQAEAGEAAAAEAVTPATDEGVEDPAAEAGTDADTEPSQDEA